MSTELLKIEAVDYYENPKEISLRSFAGGQSKGMMLEIKLTHLEGLRSQMGIELNKQQAIELAKTILEKFDSESNYEN